MHDIMAVTQEVNPDDVDKAKLCNQSHLRFPPPEAPAPAVADKTVVEDAMVLVDDAVDQETIAAIRWASKLTEDANVLSLIQSLPKGIIEEQVALYRNRDTTKPAVMKKKKQVKSKSVLTLSSRCVTR